MGKPWGIALPGRQPVAKALRLIQGAQRFSEDLDAVGGTGFAVDELRAARAGTSMEAEVRAIAGRRVRV